MHLCTIVDRFIAKLRGDPCFADASEAAQARLKGLDQPGAPRATKAANKPHKDVNTFINNQLKFVPAQPTTLPPEQMKCNILKAKAEEEIRKGDFKTCLACRTLFTVYLP